MAIIEGGESGPQVVDLEAMRAEWLGRLNDLATQVKGWAETSGWRTRTVSKPTRDAGLGRYEVPLLLMERDGVEVALNPVSRFVTGTEGAVDLYVVPAYEEVAGLYFVDGRWTLHYISGWDRENREAGVREPEALPLSEGTILWVLDDLASLG